VRQWWVRWSNQSRRKISRCLVEAVHDVYGGWTAAAAVIGIDALTVERLRELLLTSE
jgi:hypothetical protein